MPFKSCFLCLLRKNRHLHCFSDPCITDSALPRHARHSKQHTHFCYFHPLLINFLHGYCLCSMSSQLSPQLCILFPLILLSFSCLQCSWYISPAHSSRLYSSSYFLILVVTCSYSRPQIHVSSLVPLLPTRCFHFRPVPPLYTSYLYSVYVPLILSPLLFNANLHSSKLHSFALL